MTASDDNDIVQKQNNERQKVVDRMLFGFEWHVNGHHSPFKKTKNFKSDQSIQIVPKEKYLGSFGQDSCTVFSKNKSHILAVADGVGGWDRHGLDSGHLSRKLMHDVQRMCKRRKKRHNDPKKIMCHSFQSIKQSNTIEGGGTTACVVSLLMSRNNTQTSGYCDVDEDKDEGITSLCLSTANVGDSGYIIFRDDHIHYTSIQDERDLDVAPPQLVIIPDFLRVAAESKGLTYNEHILPEIDVNLHRDMRAGDVVLLASDGLWDNITMDELKQLWLECRDSPIDHFNNAVFNKARAAMKPCWMYNVEKSKPDDIVIVTARISTKLI